MKLIEAKESRKAEYKLVIKSSAWKFLDSLDEKSFSRIDEKILKLKSEPFPKSSKKLISFECYRIRVGDFRILYNLDYEKKEINILDIDRRKDVYKKK